MRVDGGTVQPVIDATRRVDSELNDLLVRSQIKRIGWPCATNSGRDSARISTQFAAVALAYRRPKVRSHCVKNDWAGDVLALSANFPSCVYKALVRGAMRPTSGSLVAPLDRPVEQFRQFKTRNQGPPRSNANREGWTHD